MQLHESGSSSTASVDFDGVRATQQREKGLFCDPRSNAESASSAFRPGSLKRGAKKDHQARLGLFVSDEHARA